MMDAERPCTWKRQLS